MILKRFVTASLLLVGALMLPRPGAVSVAQAPRPGPKDILTKVEEVYAACRSYQDSGTAVMKDLSPDSKDAEETASFTTAFVRPGSFRFDYQYRGGDKEEHYL